MEKDDALKKFYEANHIDPNAASCCEQSEYDPKIEVLPAQVDKWLRNIELEHYDLFLKLLSRYTYLTAEECQKRYQQLLCLFAEKTSRSFEDRTLFRDVLFVAVESSDAYKSGSDNVITDLHKRNVLYLSKRQIVPHLSKLEQKDLQQYQHIIFVDDIIGSSETLWGAIYTFCSRFSLDGTKTPNLYFASIAPREKGVCRLRKSCRRKNLQITPLYRDDWILKEAFPKDSDEYRCVDCYEKVIGTFSLEEGISYEMGFEKNCLLISFYYNTPNNTISTFWREIQGINDPPFPRDEGVTYKRPTVNELKRAKENIRQNAYKYAWACREKNHE